MSLKEFISQHIHSTTASISGAAASVALPVADLISKFVVGVATGVSVWLITHLISFILRKIREKKCSKV